MDLPERWQYALHELFERSASLDLELHLRVVLEDREC